MKYSIVLYISFLFTFCSCSSYLFDDNAMGDPMSTYEEFWTYVDEHYIFFDLKDIDWEEQKIIAMSQITEQTTEEELFEICNQSLLALRDTHCRLTGPGLKHTPYDFTEGYEVHFSIDNVDDNYIIDSLAQDGALYYGWLPDNIGYIYFRAMSQYGGFGRIIREMKDQGAKGLVIDVRNNGGGDSNSIPRLLSDFTQESILLGSYVEKAGPRRNDVTELLPARTDATEYDFDLPVVQIINRGGYSATSYFAAMAKEIPAITVVGQVTGGGAGGNMGYQLSNGWVLAVSVSDYIDVDGTSIELGVAPDIVIENNRTDLKNGVDKMLEKAIETLDL